MDNLSKKDKVDVECVLKVNENQGIFDWSLDNDMDKKFEEMRKTPDENYIPDFLREENKLSPTTQKKEKNKDSFNFFKKSKVKLNDSPVKVKENINDDIFDYDDEMSIFERIRNYFQNKQSSDLLPEEYFDEIDEHKIHDDDIKSLELDTIDDNVWKKIEFDELKGSFYSGKDALDIAINSEKFKNDIYEAVGKKYDLMLRNRDYRTYKVLINNIEYYLVMFFRIPTGGYGNKWFAFDKVFNDNSTDDDNIRFYRCLINHETGEYTYYPDRNPGEREEYLDSDGKTKVTIYKTL